MVTINSQMCGWRVSGIGKLRRLPYTIRTCDFGEYNADVQEFLRERYTDKYPVIYLTHQDAQKIAITQQQPLIAAALKEKLGARWLHCWIDFDE